MRASAFTRWQPPGLVNASRARRHRMTSRHVWHLGIVGLALTYLGCDGADTETHSLQQPSLTSSEGPQPDIVTPRGQRYRWVRKAVFTSPAKGTLSPIREV